MESRRGSKEVDGDRWGTACSAPRQANVCGVGRKHCQSPFGRGMAVVMETDKRGRHSSACQFSARVLFTALTVLSLKTTLRERTALVQAWLRVELE